MLLGFLRLSTNPRLIPRPLAPGVAAATIDAWLARDNIRVVCEKEEHWEALKPLLDRRGTAGNLTTDAHLAALAISHDAVLVSSDTDFARFKGLRWENPLRHQSVDHTACRSGGGLAKRRQTGPP